MSFLDLNMLFTNNLGGYDLPQIRTIEKADTPIK